MPQMGTDYDDKLYHLVAYFLLTIFWFYGLKSSEIPGKTIYIVFGCIAFGIIIEALQGKLTTSRVGDFLDIVANIIGVVIGTFFVLSNRKKLS